MIRTVFFLSALLATPVALACGGAACDHCDRTASSTETVDVDAADGTKVTLAVTGMHCGACSTKIITALNATPGVNAATVDHATGEAKIAYDESQLDVDALIAAIATAGSFVATAPGV